MRSVDIQACWRQSEQTEGMETLQEFQNAARGRGFVEIEESEGGNISWFRKADVDPETDTHERICIDSQASTLTVYWATLPWKINSKVFRSVLTLQEWFSSRWPKQCKDALMTSREAILRLSIDRNDGVAMMSLLQNNAEIIRMVVARYFGVSSDARDVELLLMQRVADRARSYEDQQNPENWLITCADKECDHLRNEAIHQKANSRLPNS